MDRQCLKSYQLEGLYGLKILVINEKLTKSIKL